MLKKQGRLVLIGHSRGAIEAAYQGYVEKHPKITDVISITGRLRHTEPTRFPCRACLHQSVQRISDAISTADQPLTPRLYTIVAFRDLAVDYRAGYIHDDHVAKIDAGHCSILFHPQMVTQVLDWLQ